jgi:chromosome segregation ATPase
MHKLEQVNDLLGKAKYEQAARNIIAHKKAELQGNSLLNNLRSPIANYEQTLNRILKLLEEVQQTNANKLLIREQCKAEVRVAKQHLESIKEYLKQIEHDFER